MTGTCVVLQAVFWPVDVRQLSPDSLSVLVSPYFHKSSGMRFQPGPQPSAEEGHLDFVSSRRVSPPRKTRF